MIPRYGSPPIAGQRYQFRRGVYALLPRGEDILLTHQDAPTPELQLPGGGIDLGEPTLPALHREVLEETGWSISNPVFLGAFRRFTFMPEYEIHAEKLCLIYRADPIAKVSDALEIGHRAVWMPLEQAIGQLGNAGDRAMVKSFLNGSPHQKTRTTR